MKGQTMTELTDSFHPAWQQTPERPDRQPFTLDAVPQCISRDRYVELIRALGLDPTNVKRVEFRTDGVYVEVMYRNERGAQQLDEYANDVVHHRVYIPVE